ncbi:MAG TPA: GspE/PulE family protein [Bacteroidales bacterium]|nr:GspE/PulE family protein [Bacteroidales bacterium]
MELLNQNDIDISLLQLITADQAWQYSIIPRLANNEVIEFYTEEGKSSQELIDELEIIFGKKIVLQQVKNGFIAKSLATYYRKGNQKASGHSGSLTFTPNSDDFLVNLITNAHDIGSSDIHIEIYEERCRIRMRIDGKLVERFVLKKDEYPAIINRLKIKANLDIAEKRLPQDGRIFFAADDNKFDIRVSVLPTLYGEKIVLRLLSKDATTIDIHKLGFQPKQLDDFLEAIKKPNGIVLISGPTGSGKTTTLYATLRILNKEQTNILTIEDPIEYTLEGINQVQLKESIGLTFASALRTFLRQDPDIIMLGEIRDSETAQMATRAALTGHLVLSTIHTNSAWGTLSRLIDMGIPSFLLAGTVNLSVAQRLVRILCPDCKTEQPYVGTELPRNFKPVRALNSHFIAKGCDKCFYTGYKGRKAVYEVVPLDNDFISIIKGGHEHLEDLYKQKNIKTLAEVAFELIETGETSIDECYALLMNQFQ